MYVVELKPRAQKFIEGQPKKIQRQFIKRIESLTLDPHLPNSKLLHTNQRIYSLRSGVYRIVYQIQEEKLIIAVAKIAHRKDVYDRLTN